MNRGRPQTRAAATLAGMTAARGTGGETAPARRTRSSRQVESPPRRTPLPAREGPGVGAAEPARRGRSRSGTAPAAPSRLSATNAPRPLRTPLPAREGPGVGAAEPARRGRSRSSSAPAAPSRPSAPHPAMKGSAARTPRGPPRPGVPASRRPGVPASRRPRFRAAPPRKKPPRRVPERLGKKYF